MSESISDQYLNELAGGVTQRFESLKGFVPSDESILSMKGLTLDLINANHLEDEVIKILLSQSKYYIGKVLGFKWFFKNLSSELCVREIFPFVSVSVRCKIINRLSKHLGSTEEAQKYFEFIRKNYSSERAHYLLPKCSPEFILSYFKKAKLTFEKNNEFRFLYNICKRYPELGIQILSSIFEIKNKSRNKLFRFKKILLYLSGNHTDLIVPFIQKHHSYMPSNLFGIKLTKKLGSRLKGDLFPDLMKNSVFKEKILFSILNNEERVKYIACVVLVNNENLTFYNWTCSNYTLCELLKLIPAEERLPMVESAFKEVYGSNFNSHSKCWTSGILELLPTKTREPYVKKLEEFLQENKAELKENVDDRLFNPEKPEEFVYLHDSNTAFEKLKEILHKCPVIYRRENILTLMVKNCSINNDLKKLQEVVELIAKRHRNDHHSVIGGFVDAINNTFPPSKLNSDILDKLKELTFFSSLKHFSCKRLYSQCMENHIQYCLENNMEADVKKYFESVVLKASVPLNFVNNFKSKKSKTFVLAVCDETVRWIRNNSSEKLCKTSERLLESLLYTCVGYNGENKNDRIFLKDIPGFEDVIKIKAKELADVGAHDWPLDVWEKVFASDHIAYNFSHSSKPKYLPYVLKRHPELIERHLEGILMTLLSSNLKEYRGFFTPFVRSVAVWGKTDKVKEIILNEFKNGDEICERKNALELYSRMCTIEEFSAAVENYLPKQDKVKQVDDGFDEMQIFIPSLIKNVEPQWKNLKLILKFFFGDYLKCVLPSFLTFCHHTRCDFVLPFLKDLLGAVPQKISYLKDIIKLIFELSDREGRSEIFAKYWDEYKHYSIRSVLLFFISKSFLESPSRESFRILEKCILESDEITLKSRPNLRMIPNEFFTDYVSLLWRFSEAQPHGYSCQQEIIYLDLNKISLLSAEFSSSIIKKYLFNPHSNVDLESFTTWYLISDGESVGERVHFILDLIKTLKPAQSLVFNFLKFLIIRSKEKPCDFVEVFEILLNNWPEYPLGVLFEERILLTYYSLHYKLIKKATDPDRIPAEFGKELKIFLSNIDNLNDLVFIYAETLKRFFKHFKTPNAVVAVKELLADTPDRTLVILGILSLPDETVIWNNVKRGTPNRKIAAAHKVLDEIFKTVEGCNDRILDIYTRSKFDFENFENFEN